MKITPERSRLFPASLAIWALVCAVGCSGEPPVPTATPVPVTVSPVLDRNQMTGVRYTGLIEPSALVPLAFRTSGYVRDLGETTDLDGRKRVLQSGDVVSSGTILARIEDREYHSRLSRAQAGVAEAHSSLMSARSQASAAKATAQQARLDFDRAQRLFATDSLTRAEFDVAKTRLQTAEAASAAASAAADAIEAKGAAARAAVVEVDALTGDTLLRAPISGVILKRQIEVGSLVAPGTVGFIVAEVSSVKLTFAVPDRMLAKLPLGSPVRARLDARPGERFSGMISRVAAAADPATRLFEVEVKIPNVDGMLKPGMIAAIEAQIPSEAMVGLIPLEAVVPGKPDGRSYAVFKMISEGELRRARRCPVTLGRPVGNRIAVLTGLASDDQVIVSGAGFLDDGDLVLPIEPLF